MRLAVPAEQEEILAYVKPHVSESLYLYIDIKKYGIGSEYLKVWVDRDQNNEITLVVMKYHTGMIIHTQSEEWDRDGVAALIEEENAMSVTGRRDLVDQLLESDALKGKYDVDYGHIFELSKYRSLEIDEDIELAGEEDAMEIARLVTADEGIGSYYEIEDYANQLIERMRTNFGRSFVIRKDGKIICHIASYAECDGLAPISGLITDPDYRSGVYGAAIEDHIFRVLKSEGFTVFSTVTTRLRKKLLESMGNECLGEYGKLMRR